MQVTFYSNKENFLELFEWLKKEFPNIKYYDNRKNNLLNETELYTGTVGYTGQVILTDENSILAQKVINNNYDLLENRYPLIHQSGIELLFGYSEDKIYNFDFSKYNPYSKDNTEEFYMCRFYVNSFYLSNDGFYSKIYQKIYRRIRRKSIKLNGEYVKDYLYGQLT